MSYVAANLQEGAPQYFTLDKKLSSSVGAACFQPDITLAVQFARKEDAEKFADAYYPFLSLAARVFA